VCGRTADPECHRCALRNERARSRRSRARTSFLLGTAGGDGLPPRTRDGCSLEKRGDENDRQCGARGAGIFFAARRVRFAPRNMHSACTESIERGKIWTDAPPAFPWCCRARARRRCVR
jgi:hypothetical protein